MEPFPSYQAHAYPSFQPNSGYGDPSMSAYIPLNAESPYGSRSYPGPRDGGPYMTPMSRQEAYCGPGGDSIARRSSLTEGIAGDPSYMYRDQMGDYSPHAQAYGPFDYGRNRSGSKVVYSSGPVRFPNRMGPTGGYGPRSKKPEPNSDRATRPMDLKRPRPAFNKARKPFSRFGPTFYCETCKVSCVGPVTYADHQKGQRHQKRVAQKKAAEQLKSDMGEKVVQPSVKTRPGELLCELCDITCTDANTYSSHLSGRQHQRTLRLHRELGKPIPDTDNPLVTKAVAEKLSTSGTGSAAAAEKPAAVVANETKTVAEKAATPTGELKHVDLNLLLAEPKPAVGEEYVDMVFAPNGKGFHFNCKLCECQFTNAESKDMHLRGRRHRLQYKRKVDPSFPVEKTSNKRGTRKPASQKRAEAMLTSPATAVTPAPRAPPKPFPEVTPPFVAPQIPFGRPFPGMSSPRFPPTPQHPNIAVENRFMSVKHASLVPTDLEAQAMKTIITICEHAFKNISDDLVADSARTEANGSGAFDSDFDQKEEQDADETKTNKTPGTGKKAQPVEDRLLRGVVRVGALGKSLLLRHDHTGDLALVCSAWPTTKLMDYLNTQLPEVLTRLDARFDYTLTTDSKAGQIKVIAVKKTNGDAATTASKESAATTPSSGTVSEWPTITVRIQVTSPAVHADNDPLSSSSGAVKAAASGTRSSQDPSTASTATEQTTTQTGGSKNNNGSQALSASAAVVPANQLSRAYQLISQGEPICKNNCVEALEAINQAKWFQNALSRQPLGMVSRILLDYLRADEDWSQLDEFATLSMLDRLLSMELQLMQSFRSPSRGPFPSPRAFMRPGPQSAALVYAPIGPSRLLRRFFESIASGMLLQLQPPKVATETAKPTGLGAEFFAFDVLAKTPVDVRERITVSAQLALRQIAFRQLWKILRIEPTAAQYSYRRRSTPEGEEESELEQSTEDTSKLKTEDESINMKSEEDEDGSSNAKRQRTEEVTEPATPTSTGITTAASSTPGAVATRASSRLSAATGTKK